MENEHYDPNESIKWVEAIHPSGPTRPHSVLILDTSAFGEIIGIKNIKEALDTGVRCFTTLRVVAELKGLTEAKYFGGPIKRGIEALLPKIKVVDVKTSNYPRASTENIVLSELSKALGKSIAYRVFIGMFDEINSELLKLERVFSFRLTDKALDDIVDNLFKDYKEAYISVGKKELYIKRLRDSLAILKNSIEYEFETSIEKIQSQNRGKLRIDYERLRRENLRSCEDSANIAYITMTRSMAGLMARRTSYKGIKSHIDVHFRNRTDVDRKVLLLSYAFPIEREGLVGLCTKDSDIKQLLVMRRNTFVSYE